MVQTNLQQETHSTASTADPSLVQLDQLIERSHAPKAKSAAVPACLVGVAVGHDNNSNLLVDFTENPHDAAIPSRATVDVSGVQPGDEVTLIFDRGQTDAPIVVGILSQPRLPLRQVSTNALQATLDDERLELTADREIVLRCGKASITLTKAGKILIRGAYVLTRSSGTNRVKGATVEIN